MIMISSQQRLVYEKQLMEIGYMTRLQCEQLSIICLIPLNFQMIGLLLDNWY